MYLNLGTFKTVLGSYWDKSCVSYTNEEGREIPIRNQCEFEDALRLAKMNGNRLKLIFYDKIVSSNGKMTMTFPGNVKPLSFDDEARNPFKNTKMNSSYNSDKVMKENTCCCSGDVPPEWFTHYMKKFKKDLLYELRSNIFEIIDNASEKEQKPFFTKSDPLDVFSGKSGPLFPPVTIQIKKKKKVSDKDGADFSEQRDLKLSKKLEKLHPTKSERLEKSDNKTKLWIEERRKLMERKRQSKTKMEKNYLVTSERKNSLKKSASFCENSALLHLNPGAEYAVTMSIKNNGKLRWSSPWLEYLEVTGLRPNEAFIHLPRLFPNESCLVTLTGRALDVLGAHYFKCKVIEEQEHISPEFTCWAKVDYFEPYEKYCNVAINIKEPDASSVKTADSVEKLIDFDKDVIASSEKKIEENILEIEKRLKYIDFLRPSTSGEANMKKTPGKTKKVSAKTPEYQTESYDLMQNLKEKEKNWAKRLEQEEVLFGFDCLRLASESNETCEVKIKPRTDENQQVERLEEIKKDCEIESSSDSELSVISMSEEDENFIVVPLPSKSPSPAESMHEDKKCVNVDSEDKRTASLEKSEPAAVKEEPKKPEIRIKIHVDKKANTPENLSLNQISPTRNRRSPFGEEIPKSRPKKIKSKSTEYHFTTANLTQPTFTPIPDGFYTKRPSKFTFTGEKKGESSDGVFEFTYAEEKEEKSQRENFRGKTIPKTDASGRVIYAVTNMGRCLPVGDFFENEQHLRNVKEESLEADDQGNQNQHERRNERFNEVPSVNILPNVLVNGASNVASIAFNTAKSMFNNLHSAFVTEGKTELGKCAFEDKKKVSMENMFKLYEMGFSDLQINRKLLLIHENDLSKVIEELVRLEESSSKRVK